MLAGKIPGRCVCVRVCVSKGQRVQRVSEWKNEPDVRNGSGLVDKAHTGCEMFELEPNALCYHVIITVCYAILGSIIAHKGIIVSWFLDISFKGTGEEWYDSSLLMKKLRVKTLYTIFYACDYLLVHTCSKHFCTVHLLATSKTFSNGLQHV